MYDRQFSMSDRRLHFPIMNKEKSLLPYLLLFMASHAIAGTPCDFKGVYVGDKTTPAALMKAFGINKYKMNPKIPDILKLLKLTKMHAPIDAIRTENYNIGPSCTDKNCSIPFGVGIGNNSYPVSVYVSFPEGQITEIDVTFNQIYWEDLRPVIDNKYGSDWGVKEDSNFRITDENTKQSIVFDRITLNHRTNGVNPKTKDTCQIWATNYDVIIAHHDPVGTYQSVFVIKLVSNNF